MYVHVHVLNKCIDVNYTHLNMPQHIIAPLACHGLPIAHVRGHHTGNDSERPEELKEDETLVWAEPADM